MKKLIIAIDGPSGSGKSTTGKALANRLGYLYIDTGAMYRAVALFLLRNNVSLSDESEITKLLKKIEIDLKGDPYNLQVVLNGENVTDQIRTAQISQSASIVSAINSVRQFLVERQRYLGRDGGVVMDGRDIGTHVFPQAQVKFFLFADLIERARRRNLEEVTRGEHMSLQETLQEIEERDSRDSKREYAPLRPATDSIQLNTSNLSPNQVVDLMMEHIKKRDEAIQLGA
ncbi:MAG: (d)CMP kinase [Blastocatellia bacterium]|nr:(d)CMP kinase [Blastocatellia bacterium]